MDVINYALIGLGTGAITAILALGVVLIYRGSGVINFAHGGFAMAGAYIAMDLRINEQASFAVALTAAVVGTAVLGLLVQLLVMGPLRTASPLARVIATLGILTVVTEILLLRYGSNQYIVPLPLESSPVEITTDIVVARQNLVLLVIAIVITLVLTLVMARTRLGHAVTASAENARSAAALGWSPQLLSALTWTLGGALAGAAGAFFPATSVGFMSVRQMSVLIIGALATALLAQFRSYPLALVGGLGIGIAQALATNYVNQTGIPDAVPFLVIIVVLVVRGRGLPVRGSTLDRLPRVGTGKVNLLLVVPVAVVAIGGVRLWAPEDWFGPLIISLCFAIVGLSTVVLTGYAGQLSIAQFGLAGVGAFAAGRLADAKDWPLELALPAGVVAAMVTGLIFGLPALRTRGVNLAVVTFGLGFALHQILFSNSSYTGGEFQTRIRETTFLGFDVEPIEHKANYFVLAAILFVVAALVVANLRRGRSGRRLLAVRTNERAAAAVGVSVFQAKLYAFVVASAIAGLGGVLFGFSYSTIQFQELFESDASISLLVITVIGSAGYVLGPLVGSILAPAGVGELFFDTSSAASSDADSWVQYLPLITGFLLILTLIVSQHGIVVKASSVIRHLAELLPRRGRGATAPVAQATVEAELVAPRTLVVRGVTQQFGGFTALSDVDLVVRPGEVVGLLGPNGAGKTTLIDTITGYNKATAGQVLLDDTDITSWSPHRRARAGLTRSFQSLELFDDLTVLENLLAASDEQDFSSGLTDLVWPGRTELNDTVRAAITELDLEDTLERRPEDLSYGRRRLVAIARAVASRPSVLLLDEPAAGLDETESAELGRLIRRLADHWGIAVLLIEHDVPMVLRHADRVLVLDFGVTIAEGTPEQIKQDPAVRRAYLGDSEDESEDATV